MQKTAEKYHDFYEKTANSEGVVSFMISELPDFQIIDDKTAGFYKKGRKLCSGPLVSALVMQRKYFRKYDAAVLSRRLGRN